MLKLCVSGLCRCPDDEQSLRRGRLREGFDRPTVESHSQLPLLRYLDGTSIAVDLDFCSVMAKCYDPPNGLSGMVGKSKDASSVVPTTGAFGYVAPFKLPPIRGHVQPVLSLSYESGIKVGDAGVDGALSIPSTERAVLSGWPKYVDDGAPQNEDRFSYDGQPLTFTCVIGGLQVCPRNDPVGPMLSWANGYRHHRMQVEGSFERCVWRPGSQASRLR